MKKMLIWCAAIFFCGCLNFGDNLELRGEKFSSKYIEQVTRLTGIKFPAGTRGIAYFYLGSGIDNSIAAKLEIPIEKKDEFLENNIFQKGKIGVSLMQSGKLKDWWLPDTLEERIDRTLDLPNVCLLKCSLGKEKGSLIVYIVWSET